MTWLVIGGGVSGLGAAKLLRSRGAAVRVSDGKKLTPAMRAAFERLGVELCEGGHAREHLADATNVVVSPGIKANHELVVAASESGLPLISEIDLALEAFRGRLIGVTGTNGKSTTCAMLGHVLSAAGVTVSVGGNFGDPPTAMLAEGRMGEVLVLELSSYQLEQSRLIRANAAVFSSFSHDHMARHGSLEAYFRAKWRLVDELVPGATFATTAEVLEFARRFGCDLRSDIKLVVASPMRELANLGIPELHNQLNAAFTCACVGALLQRDPVTIVPLLRGFRGLPHRCELVGSWRGHAVINDSKSTNVESTLVALKNQTTPVTLMMGGQGKHEPYSPILAEKSKIAQLIAFGASGGEIAQALSHEVPTHQFPTLARALASLGGILEMRPSPVLFSPGCASFDEFTNYEARGLTFVESMRALGLKFR